MPRFTPVDHDPFAEVSLAYMPVDHNPFEGMASGLAPHPEPVPEFPPGSREWYESRLYGNGTPSDAAAQNAQGAEFVASMAPVTGEVLSARDAWRSSGKGAEALSQGQYSQAASEYGNMMLGVLGAVPGAGLIARGTKRGAAWMDRNLPAGFNRLLDAAMPSDPKNTTFSGAGPTTSTAKSAQPKVNTIDPNSLIFREGMQNNTSAIRELYPAGQGYDPIVTARTADGPLIIDGHNRAAVAIERGDQIPSIEIDESVYQELLARGWDETDISHAVLEYAGLSDAASGIRQKFQGVDFWKSSDEIEKILDGLKD